MSMGIYKITNKVNGKMYVGQSVNIEKRWYQHKNSCEKGLDTALYRAMREYGVENFEFEVIEECLEEELNEKEIYYIGRYNTYCGTKDSNGYNMTIGGEGLKSWSITDEVRDKMREAKRVLLHGSNEIWSEEVSMNNEIIRNIIKEYDMQTAMLYMILLSHRNPKTDICFPTMEELAIEVGMSRTTIKTMIKKLKNSNYITVDTGKQGLSNIYFSQEKSFLVKAILIKSK